MGPFFPLPKTHLKKGEAQRLAIVGKNVRYAKEFTICQQLMQSIQYYLRYFQYSKITSNERLNKIVAIHEGITLTI